MKGKSMLFQHETPDCRNQRVPTRPANILALDLGVITGWAARLNGAIHSGVWMLDPDLSDLGESRFSVLQARLEELWRTVGGGIDAVHVGQVPHYTGWVAAFVCGGYHAIALAWSENRHIPFQGLSTFDVKRYAVGKGNANKDAMVEAARARGWDPVDDNEADALWLLDYALHRPVEVGTLDSEHKPSAVVEEDAGSERVDRTRMASSYF